MVLQSLNVRQFQPPGLQKNINYQNVKAPFPKELIGKASPGLTYPHLSPVQKVSKATQFAKDFLAEQENRLHTQEYFERLRQQQNLPAVNNPAHRVKIIEGTVPVSNINNSKSNFGNTYINHYNDDKGPKPPKPPGPPGGGTGTHDLVELNPITGKLQTGSSKGIQASIESATSATQTQTVVTRDAGSDPIQDFLQAHHNNMQTQAMMQTEEITPPAQEAPIAPRNTNLLNIITGGNTRSPQIEDQVVPSLSPQVGYSPGIPSFVPDNSPVHMNVDAYLGGGPSSPKSGVLKFNPGSPSVKPATSPKHTVPVDLTDLFAPQQVVFHPPNLALKGKRKHDDVQGSIVRQGDYKRQRGAEFRTSTDEVQDLRNRALATRSETQRLRNRAQATRNPLQRLRNLREDEQRAQDLTEGLRNRAMMTRSEEQRKRNLAMASRSEVQGLRNKAMASRSELQRLRNLATASRKRQ